MTSRFFKRLSCALLASAAISHAATTIAVTDSTLPLNQGDFFLGGLYSNVVAASWGQSTTVTNATIAASLQSSDPAFRTGTAYLMNAIGPGTTAANQVVPPVSFTAPFDLATFDFPAPLTILFTGVTLGPGTYYLVLTAPFSGPFSTTPFPSPLGWKYANHPVINSAPAVNIGLTFAANTLNTSVNSYAPSSSFGIDTVSRLLFDVFVGSQVISLGTDTTTGGSWPSRYVPSPPGSHGYGSGGYFIPNGVSAVLDHINLSFTQFFNYTWAALTSDPRAPRTSVAATSGIASAITNYYGQSFNINLNNYDNKPHMVSIYMLDWDGSSRSQTITITDASTGELYDARTFSNFHNGVYAAWQLKGNLTIKVTPTSGPSAVVSGIFID